VFRSYTDRKKKIIREWNKNNSSPRPPETLSAAGEPLRHPYMGAEFLHNSYAPYGVKDEPLRTDYYSAYAAYGAEGNFGVFLTFFKWIVSSFRSS